MGCPVCWFARYCSTAKLNYRIKMRIRFASILAIALGAAAQLWPSVQLRAQGSESTPLWLRGPAISPDGSQIVFQYKGDLYKVASAGGPAQLLTTYEGQDANAIWSRDGKQIAFASTRYGNPDVFVMPSTGGEAKRLTYHSNYDVPSDFAPDGKSVLFSSLRQDPATSAQFPMGMLNELYSVPVKGGRAIQIMAVPSEKAKYNSTGTQIAYHDLKGYEDTYRKHHTSSIARDLWVYDLASKKQRKITDFPGEDRSPSFGPGNKDIYYVSEQAGAANIFKRPADGSGSPIQITSLLDHPVRSLTISNSGLMAFSYDGELYTVREGETPKKVAVSVSVDVRTVVYKNVPVMGGATDFAVSPNGKELAFIVRGEVFVAAIEGGETKRITNTPQQERNISWSPDGKALAYSGERGGSWNIYQSKIVRKEEPYFHLATVLKEEPIIATAADEFQPAFSPDGKEVAFYEERTTLRVFNLASKQTRTVVPGTHSYSYSDGDQMFDWSPDGKWLLTNMLPANHWLEEIGMVAADGKSPIINITQSGYDDYGARWMNGGKAIVYSSWRDGMKNHGSWGAESDAYAIFPTQEGLDRFRLNKQEYALLKEREEKDKKEKEEKEKANPTKDKKLAAAKTKGDSIKNVTVKIELEGLSDRRERLTLHSSFLNDAILSKDGEKLYYICKFEKGYNLWVSNLREKDAKILAKLDADYAGGLTLDKEGKNIFLISNGGIMKVEAEAGKVETIALKGTMVLDAAAERSYMFDHAWRQVTKKFYKPDLQGVKWDFYKASYAKFLPYINNNADFTEMLSEMLGELNASHTGSGARQGMPNADNTASLGLLYDMAYTGKGLKIAEVISRGPAAKADSKIKAGMIIEKIDGAEVSDTADTSPLLNLKAGANTLLTLTDPSTKATIEQVIKPIGYWDENQLMYMRWVENRRKEVDKLSGGRLGYVHVRGMDDASYRVVYEDVLGKCPNKEALIVDTRFNGGGWLHDDLCTFLSGKKYVDVAPRGSKIGFEPQRKWTKPSCVLMSESNYSDAHFFPFSYKELGIGKLVGMPVAGTATAVWWESQIDPTIYFGIPQVGILNTKGEYLENKQLEPDVKQAMDPEIYPLGRDQQLEAAVKSLLSELK